MEIPINEHHRLTQLINEFFKTDITRKDRHNEIVNGRKAYAKIMRDMGYSYKAIGNRLMKNHATIIHYLHQIDWDLKNDYAFIKRYGAVCEDFFKPIENYTILSKYDDLVAEIKALKQTNRMLMEDNGMLRNELKKLKYADAI